MQIHLWSTSPLTKQDKIKSNFPTVLKLSRGISTKKYRFFYIEIQIIVIGNLQNDPK